MDYDLELERVINHINSNNYKRVLLQLPEGLKNKAIFISDNIKEKTKAIVFIWSGSCYGACDVPEYVESMGIDFLVQWGHSEWKY
jgi:2-(3-amino-3-carboxypropyl)histidine synthase